MADFEVKFVSLESKKEGDDEGEDLVVAPYKIQDNTDDDEDKRGAKKVDVRQKDKSSHGATSRSSSQTSSSSYSDEESSLVARQKPTFKLPRKSIADLAGRKRR